MVSSHVGHDCVVEDGVILVNNVSLAGHVHIGEKTIIGGLSAVAQFIKVGKSCFIGGLSGIDRDIPSFCTAIGSRVLIKGTNIIGLKRSGRTRETISKTMKFIDALQNTSQSPKEFVSQIENVADYESNELVQEMISTIKNSKYGIAQFGTGREIR